MTARCKPIVLISYAREDEPEEPTGGEVKWLSFVTEYLGPAEQVGVFEMWIDPMTRVDDWGPENVRRVAACDFFVPLLSDHALSSNYTLDRELAIIRKRQTRGERVCLYPLLLTPEPESAFELLGGEDPSGRSGIRLSNCPRDELTRRMLDAIDEIVEIAAEMAGPRKWRRQPRKQPGSAAGIAPVSSPALRIDAGREIERQVGDRNSLNVWLKGQNPEVVSAIAARAALRAPHGVVEAARKGEEGEDKSLFLVLAGALFRATALARIALKFPARAHEMHAQAQAAAARLAAAPAAAAAAALTTGTTATTHALGAVAAALTSALAAADSASRDAPLALPGAVSAGASYTAPVAWPSGAVASAAVYVGAIAAADRGLRMEIGSDVLALQELGVGELMDLPLWSDDPPDWAADGWDSLKTALPSDQGWDVWVTWYEERLSGGSRAEDYELVFASVPQKIWEKGPAAANAWIKEHLPPESSRPELPSAATLLSAPV